MRFLRATLARIAGLFTGRRADDDVRAELETHLDMETAENIRRGMDPAEARRQALLAAGGLTQAAEAVHDRAGIPWLEAIGSDIKFALRALRHSPGFTTVVILTLALGIGANTAIFSVVRGVLLKPLPHRDGDRLVYLRQSADGPGRGNLNFSVPEVRDFRNGAPALGGIAEYSDWFGTLDGEGGAVPMSLRIGLVTGNFFEIMGLSPVMGRLTTPGDDGRGVPPVMVLTYDFWKQRFGGDSSVIGKVVHLSGQPITIIGVLQPAPFFPTRVHVLCNMVLSEHHLSALMEEGRTHRMTEMVARLANGATVEQARNQVETVYSRMRAEHVSAYDPGSHYQVAVIPFKTVLGERAQLTLWLLMGAAAFVLIISAANVTNLTLIRGVRRAHELVVRAALGAGVARLRRLLLVENLLLALGGAVVGIVIAIGGVGLLTALAERYSPRAGEIRLDGQVLAFALGIAIAVALLLSFVAAVPREGTFGSAITAGAWRVSGSLRKQRLQRGLVVAQVAVSVVLLAGAGLLTRTMIQLSQVDTGLRADEVLTIPVQLFNPADLGPSSQARNQLAYARMRDEIRGLPGVTEAGIGSTVPLRSSDLGFDLVAEGKSLASGEAVPHADVRSASPEYFRASGIPLLLGREFAATDGPTAGKVVILNKTLADRLFPGQDPIGRRVAFTGEVLKFTPFTGEWRSIVGVVADTRDGGLDAPPRGVLFTPFVQEFAIFGAVIVRTEREASTLVGPATRIVREVAPGVPVENVLTIKQIKEESVSPRRLNAVLVSSFGMLAVIIAAVGIAGVLAFSVSARTNEIGIRMALGADRNRVQRMILGEGGVLLAIGLVLGVAGAYFVARVMQGLLFGVTPRDPVTLIGVALLMAAIGTLACWIPALRAARIDPAVTMRAL